MSSVARTSIHVVGSNKMSGVGTDATQAVHYIRCFLLYIRTSFLQRWEDVFKAELNVLHAKMMLHRLQISNTQGLTGTSSLSSGRKYSVKTPQQPL